jgi:hypothetical protein
LNGNFASDVCKKILTFAIQDLEREINDLECSSENFLQRSSQLTTMISLMSMYEPLMRAVDLTCSKEPSVQGENIGAASEEEPVEQPAKSSKQTKLQQMMEDSAGFSSKFVSEALKSEANASHSTPVNPVELVKDPTSRFLEQNCKALNFAKDSFCTLRHARLNSIHSQRSLGEVSDGPSQRAASLLLSRSSNAAFQTPELAIGQDVSVKMQHWNGAELGPDDPYVFLVLF